MAGRLLNLIILLRHGDMDLKFLTGCEETCRQEEMQAS